MARKNRLFAKFANSTRVDETGTVDASLSISAELTSSGGMTSVATLADIPLANNSAGDQVFVEATDQLFIWNGTGWYNIALINTAPSITAGGAGSYELASDGTPTVITLTAEDPDGLPVTWSYSVTSGSLQDTTVTNVDNVFTITPGTVAATFQLAFIASDGVNTATDVNVFTLSFVTATDWSSTSINYVFTPPAGTSYDFAGNSGNERLGIDATGNVAIASNPYTTGTYASEGTVWIFRRSGPGATWGLDATLPNPDAVRANERYGMSCAISGNYAVAGRTDGKATAYTYSGGSWSPQTISPSVAGEQDYGLICNINSATDTMCLSLSQNKKLDILTTTDNGSSWSVQQTIDGSNINGTDYTGNYIFSAGRVWLGEDLLVFTVYQVGIITYTRSGSTWSYAGLAPFPSEEGTYGYHQFGDFDAATGTLVLIADYSYTVGYVGVWTIDAAGAITQDQILDLSSGLPSDNGTGANNFEWARVGGGTIAVADTYAYNTADGNDGYEGQIALYQLDNDTWTYQRYLGVSGSTNAAFGRNHAIDGDALVVLTGQNYTGGAFSLVFYDGQA